MKQVAATLKTFLSGFGIPAYIVGTVPDSVQLPYITYPLTEPEWNKKATFYVQIWYRSTSNTALLEKADQIVKEIGEGIILSSGDGFLVIYPETPLIQILVDGDYRSAYINLSINCYHMPGE